MWIVYVLLCSDKSLYTGYTDNLEKRFVSHKEGKGAKYTKSHKPIKIVYSEIFEQKNDALKREAEIKKWERKDKIQRLGLSLLINGE